jgi:hypothetical protein
VKLLREPTKDVQLQLLDETHQIDADYHKKQNRNNVHARHVFAFPFTAVWPFVKPTVPATAIRESSVRRLGGSNALRG